MPYDALGRGISSEELRREQEYIEKHPKRIAVANATLPVMGIGFFVAGVVSVGGFLITLIAQGGLEMFFGLAGFAVLIGAAVFGLVESRIDI